MNVPATPSVRDEVSPLELFFDLVFVFAISQLSTHLLNDVTWRGAAETVVLIIAVFGAWSYASFEATLFHVSEKWTRSALLVAMLLGLFMNAAIGEAFGPGRWAFVVPFLLIRVGNGVSTLVRAPSRQLREHYTRMLIWILASAPLWVVGAIVGSQVRLAWWALAAGIDLIAPGSRTLFPAGYCIPSTSSSTPSTCSSGAGCS